MSALCSAADDVGVISPDRVREVVQAILRAAQSRGLTDEVLESLSGVKARRIKSYRVEGKEPSLSAALSLGLALGETGLNPILNLIGYCARPLGEGDEQAPMALVAAILQSISTLANAAADNRFDHTEMPAVREAADQILRLVVPLSSAGRQG